MEQEQLHELDDYLAQVAKTGVTRFSPGHAADYTGFDIQKARELLLQRVEQGVLNVHFEVECPEGDSDFFVDNIAEIDWEEERQCRVCDNCYVPSQDHIWLTFDLKEPSLPKVSSLPERNNAHPGGRLRDFTETPTWDSFICGQLVDLDGHTYSDHLARVEGAMNNGTNKEKGDTLEELAEMLLRSIKTFEVYPKKNTPTGELDRYIFVRKIPGTCFQDWSQFVPVECKNWSSPITGTEVDRLRSHAVDMHGKIGIMFSSMGVTGDSLHDGWGKIRNLFLREQHVTIVITLDDLRGIQKSLNPLEVIERRQREVYISG